MNDFISNIDSIKALISSQFEVDDPIILDNRYMELRDSPRMRGEAFWNSNQVFYFIERDIWEEFKFNKENHKHNPTQTVPRKRRSKSAYFYNYK